MVLPYAGDFMRRRILREKAKAVPAPRMGRGPGAFCVNVSDTDWIGLIVVRESRERFTDVEVTTPSNEALLGPNRAGIKEEVTTGPGEKVARAPVNVPPGKPLGTRLIVTVSKAKTGWVMLRVKSALISCLFLTGLPGVKSNNRVN